MLDIPNIDVVYETAMNAIREYYRGPVMKTKKQIVEFFRERGLDEYLSFPRRCFVPWSSKENNLILVGHDRTGFYPQI